MDSSVAPSPHDRNPIPSLSTDEQRLLRRIRIAFGTFTVILLALGMRSVIRSADGWLLTPDAAFIPALFYALFVFYGRDLVMRDDASRRRRLWARLLWLLPATTVLHFAGLTVALFFTVKADEKIFDLEMYQTALAVAITIVASALWARVGVESVKRSNGAAPLPIPRRVGLSLLVGGLLMLSSLVLDVGYSAPGWQVALFQRGWVTNDIIIGQSTRVAVNITAAIFYTVGILLAVVTVATAFLTLAGKRLHAQFTRLSFAAVVVVFWFTTTNYFYTYWCLDFLGVFDLFSTWRDYAAVWSLTAAWVLAFLLGTILWLRHRERISGTSVAIRRALLIWAMPLMFFTVTSWWYPMGWEIRGLVTYVIGFQIVAVCWWKLERHRNALQVEEPQARLTARAGKV